MIQKWPSTSGCYEGVEVKGNAVDCGPLRNCGSGLYIGSEGWYPETPYGSLTDGQTSGLITGTPEFRHRDAGATKAEEAEAIADRDSDLAALSDGKAG